MCLHNSWSTAEHVGFQLLLGRPFHGDHDHRLIQEKVCIEAAAKVTPNALGAIGRSVRVPAGTTPELAVLAKLGIVVDGAVGVQEKALLIREGILDQLGLRGFSNEIHPFQLESYGSRSIQRLQRLCTEK